MSYLPMFSKQNISTRPQPMYNRRRKIPFTGTLISLPLSVMTYDATNGWKSLRSDVLNSPDGIPAALGSLDTELGQTAFLRFGADTLVLTLRKGVLVNMHLGATVFSGPAYELSYEMGDNPDSQGPTAGRIAQILV